MKSSLFYVITKVSDTMKTIITNDYNLKEEDMTEHVVRV